MSKAGWLGSRPSTAGRRPRAECPGARARSTNAWISPLRPTGRRRLPSSRTSGSGVMLTLLLTAASHEPMNQDLSAPGDDYPLSAEQIASYRREGYLVLPDVVTEPELLPLESTFQHFIEGRVSGMGRDFCDMSGPYGRAF